MQRKNNFKTTPNDNNNIINFLVSYDDGKKTFVILKQKKID